MQTAASHRLLIADDHPLFRGALRQALADLLTDAVIVETGSFEEMAQALEKEADIDLILLDLNIPGVRGFSGLLYLRAQFPSIPVVVVSASEDAAVIGRAIALGASGFIAKSLSLDAIRTAVTEILAGEIWTPPGIKISTEDQTSELIARLSSLTPQQVRVLMMLSEGLLNKQIAYLLSVSEATVKAHVSAILQKLGVDSRTQAVIAAAKIEAGQWQGIGVAE